MMKVLAVIDMQNDFIDGALGTKEAEAIVPRVQSKLQEYRGRGDMVVFTRDTHQSNYLNTQEGRKLPIIHCIAGTEGWQIADGLYLSGEKIVDKPAFGSLELAEYLGDLENLEEIELVGLCTDICVISNALILKAKLPEVKISVDAGCCAGVTPESHENALRAMQGCQIEIF